ncbi:pyridoxal-phosphate dependent enzyme [soil metagenome]
MLFEEKEPEFNQLNSPLFKEKGISVIIARLDKIHPIISGNKLFKLYYFLQNSLRQNLKPILTFGGAYSNHLVATAYACKIMGIPSIGVVRGERSSSIFPTLLQCESYGMQLHFISREAYQLKNLTGFQDQIISQFGDCIIVPEGGYHPLGAEGASLIMGKIQSCNPTHVGTPVGTATTLAGLLKGSTDEEKIIAIPVLKNMNDLPERLSFLGCGEYLKRLEIFDQYHFGGYAKKTASLIHFMNDLFLIHRIPTDFVYTAKMMYGIFDKIHTGYFPRGSNIVCIHTGGLQGNASLPAGTLVF